jgi:anti-sigma B factor antagonist
VGQQGWYEVLDGGGPVEVMLSGDIDVTSEAQVSELLAGFAGRDVIVDLARVGFIDSTGLASVLTGYRSVTEAGGTLVLRKPSPHVAHVLALSAVDTVLKVIH